MTCRRIALTGELSELVAAHKMITICHLDNSRSERIIWFMALGLAYDPNRFEPVPASFAPEDLKGVHQLGVVLPQGGRQ